MVTNSILVRRNKTTGAILHQQLLFDDETTEHMIIDNLPAVEDKPGFTSQYLVSDTGEVTVEYTEIPKTETQILEEKMEVQDQLIADLMLELASLKGGN